MNVNIPMGMTLLSGYLVLYTFFGVFFYEGFNCFNIFTGISDSITPISPDITAEACKPDPAFLSFDWFYYKIVQFVDFLKSLASFASASMFEIIILLTLLGGISVYRKEWTGASLSKIGVGAFSASNLSSVFKHLFAWLILINVILIIIMVIFMVKKYKMLTDLNIEGKNDLSSNDQTLRSRMAGNNPSFKSDGPAVSMRAQNRIKAQRASEQANTDPENSQSEEKEQEGEEEEKEGEEKEQEGEEEEKEGEEGEEGEKEEADAKEEQEGEEGESKQEEQEVQEGESKETEKPSEEENK